MSQQTVKSSQTGKQEPLSPEESITKMNESEETPVDVISPCEDTVNSVNAADPTNADLRMQLEQAQEKAEKNWDIALRTKAEMDNLRKRTEKDVDNARKFALERMAHELLAVRDSMELGLVAAREEGANIASLIEGSELTLKMLVTAMEKFKIEPIDPIGQKFNPDQHQALAMQPSTDHEPNTVITVTQKGYLLNERLLRPALVVVSTE